MENGFEIEEIQPSNEFAFSTHSVPPDQVLNLCQTVYSKHPKAYVIKIYGEKWDIKIGLSENASTYLKKALTAFKKALV